MLYYTYQYRKRAHIVNKTFTKAVTLFFEIDLLDMSVLLLLYACLQQRKKGFQEGNLPNKERKVIKLFHL